MVSIDKIMKYEDGSMSTREIVEMFAELIEDGTAFQLQGSIYGRPAANFIQSGIIAPNGEITEKGKQLIEDAAASGEFYEDPEEPDHDDSIKCCPDCERPNQFGELCENCRREQEEEL